MSDDINVTISTTDIISATIATTDNINVTIDNYSVNDGMIKISSNDNARGFFDDKVLPGKYL